MQKIPMPNPIAELDGDEMTRVLWRMIKETLRIMGAPDIGGVRAPLYDITEEDKAICRECAKQIQILVAQYA